MKPFDHYYQALKTTNEGVIDASWGQGKTTFGGMSAALALAAIEREHPQQAPLRSISVNFCGALTTETPFTTQTRVLREGRSVSHYQAEVHQNDACTTLLNACYGAQRDSDVQVKAPQKIASAPDTGKKLGYIAGLTPEFVRHVDFSYLGGGMPFTNSKENHVHGWMRFNDGEGIMGEAHLIALIDTWPPATLQKLAKVAPCASITWSLEFLVPLSDLETPLAGNEWLYYEVNIEEAHGGFAHTTAEIYRADGTLLALSRQLVLVYDKR